jgi:hypothetical protein
MIKDLRQAKLYLLLILAIGFLLIFWQRFTREKLVVYCAHDAVFAEAILDDFEKQTGIPVVVKYDTEATKSLGLVEQIIQDGAKPRCDVFWNNEMLGTVDLARLAGASQRDGMATDSGAVAGCGWTLGGIRGAAARENSQHGEG